MSENLQKKLEDAIQRIIHEDDDPKWNMQGGLVTMWAVIAEVVLPTQEKVILMYECSPDTPLWRIIGMVDYADMAWHDQVVMKEDEED